MPSKAPAEDAFRVRLVSVSELTPNPANARKHPADQVEAIRASMVEFGWTNPILADLGDDGIIVAGHGRLEAIKGLHANGIGVTLPNGQTLPGGMVPVIDCSDWTKAQRRAYTLADNRLAETSTWDKDLLKGELVFLDEVGFSLDLTGFDSDAVARALGKVATQGANSGEEAYSRKIKAPIYEVKGDVPEVAELIDDTKTRALVAEIAEAEDKGLPTDVAMFLRAAAERHTVFNFRRIADFYAAADEETQLLMERSALVIVDFGQAIENGFVKMTKRLGKLANGSEPASEEEAETLDE